MAFIRLLRPEEARQLETLQVVVAQVQPKDANKAVKVLQQAYPLPQLHHVKRIRRALQPDGKEPELHIIVCTHQNSRPLEDIMDELKLKGIALSDARIAEVSAHAPVTLAQFTAWNPLWPLSFHDPRSGVIEADVQPAIMEQHLQLAIEQASKSQTKVGAVIVDPNTNRVVAIAGDNRNVHPLQHAVICAINFVGESLSRSLDEEEELASSSAEQSQSRKRKSSDSSPSLTTNGYLCSGLDVYVTREPCVMCAMALVHSRIRRLVYGAPNRSCGGAGSLFQIHSEPKLNHHYEVYVAAADSEIAIQCKELQS